MLEMFVKKYIYNPSTFLNLVFGSEHYDQHARSFLKLNYNFQQFFYRTFLSKINSMTLKTHILIFNMPKTSKLTTKISLQLVACWSEYSDSKIGFKIEF